MKNSAHIPFFMYEKYALFSYLSPGGFLISSQRFDQNA